MISGIGSSLPMGMIGNQSSTKNSLTEENQQLISETLSNFDSENLTQADASSIVEIFSEAGIEPGQAFEAALSELGFSAKSIGDLAGVGESAGSVLFSQVQQQTSEEVSELVDFVATLLDERLGESISDSLSDEDKEYIFTQINEKFGFDNDDSIINLTA